jgi:hypothetical protein
MIELDDWAVVAPHGENVYAEPKQCLRGCREDGHYVRTSPIAGINGDVITTRSGTQYKLLKPNPQFVQWCHDNNYHVPTEQEPIRCL